MNAETCFPKVLRAQRSYCGRGPVPKRQKLEAVSFPPMSSRIRRCRHQEPPPPEQLELQLEPEPEQQEQAARDQEQRQCQQPQEQQQCAGEVAEW